MIEEQVKVHDKFSLEIKLGFLARDLHVNEFSVSSWLFVPNSLDINRWNYPKENFYRDIKSNIRLITPVYLLEDIADKSKEPYRYLEESLKRFRDDLSRDASGAFEYHIRMYVSIVKSALREEIAYIIKKSGKDYQHLIDKYQRDVGNVASNYRSLRQLADKPGIRDSVLNYFLFGDEFMSNLIEQHTFKLLEGLKKRRHLHPGVAEQLMRLIHTEISYKQQQGWPTVKKTGIERNRDLVHRLGLLKKYAENELFLNVVRRREGVWVEQIYFSIAAGISMVFATAIAFSFQKQYGNLTMPFFVALVISYMLKDRLKELARYYLAHRWGRRFFDMKTKISLSGHDIGWHKEGMDFISEKKVPAEVLRMRDRSAILEAENRNNREQIILYRKLVRLNRDSLNKVSPYPTAGMNDIIRFNVSNYIQKMDNPVVPLYVPEEGNKAATVNGLKVYYLNLIMQFKHTDGVRYKRYRIVMNRTGIVEIEKF